MLGNEVGIVLLQFLTVPVSSWGVMSVALCVTVFMPHYEKVQLSVGRVVLSGDQVEFRAW